MNHRKLFPLIGATLLAVAALAETNSPGVGYFSRKHPGWVFPPGAAPQGLQFTPRPEGGFWLEDLNYTYPITVVSNPPIRQLPPSNYQFKLYDTNASTLEAAQRFMKFNEKITPGISTNLGAHSNAVFSTNLGQHSYLTNPSSIQSTGGSKAIRLPDHINGTSPTWREDLREFLRTNRTKGSGGGDIYSEGVSYYQLTATFHTCPGNTLEHYSGPYIPNVSGFAYQSGPSTTTEITQHSPDHAPALISVDYSDLFAVGERYPWGCYWHDLEEWPAITLSFIGSDANDDLFSTNRVLRMPVTDVSATWLINASYTLSTSTPNLTIFAFSGFSPGPVPPWLDAPDISGTWLVHVHDQANTPHTIDGCSDLQTGFSSLTNFTTDDDGYAEIEVPSLGQKGFYRLRMDLP